MKNTIKNTTRYFLAMMNFRKRFKYENWDVIEPFTDFVRINLIISWDMNPTARHQMVQANKAARKNSYLSHKLISPITQIGAPVRECNKSIFIALKA